MVGFWGIFQTHQRFIFRLCWTLEKTNKKSKLLICFLNVNWFQSWELKWETETFSKSLLLSRCSPVLLPVPSSIQSKRTSCCRPTASGCCDSRFPMWRTAAPASPPKKTSRSATTRCCGASWGPPHLILPHSELSGMWTAANGLNGYRSSGGRRSAVQPSSKAAVSRLLTSDDLL